MSLITILSLLISSVCLSDAIVHLVQEMVKISRGKITGLLIIIFIFIEKLQLSFSVISLEKNEMKNEMNEKMPALTSANLHHFLDEMNYSLTQIDRANPETQYCH